MILCDSTTLTEMASLATLLTAIATLITVWLMFSERRARIIISIEPHEKIFFLKIENVGKLTATNVKIYIDNQFINSLYNERWKNILIRIQSRKFHLCAGTIKYYPLVHCYSSHDKGNFSKEMINNWYDKYMYLPMRIIVEYNSWYFLEKELYIDNFNSEAAIIPTTEIKQVRELAAIKRIISKRNNG